VCNLGTEEDGGTKILPHCPPLSKHCNIKIMEKNQTRSHTRGRKEWNKGEGKGDSQRNKAFHLWVTTAEEIATR